MTKRHDKKTVHKKAMNGIVLTLIKHKSIVQIKDMRDRNRGKHFS